VPAGRVIRQSPAAGSPVAPGERVRVTVSKAPAQVQVPNLVGSTYADAERRLREAGLAPVRQEEFRPDHPAERVIAQNPQPNAAVAPGSQVGVLVSMGPPPTPSPEPIRRGVVPNVIGRPEADARAMIRQAGLVDDPYANYQGREQVPDNIRTQVCVGCVLSTTPAPGTNLGAGIVRLAVRRD
jgi:serine/threonine-protein kinase